MKSRLIRDIALIMAAGLSLQAEAADITIKNPYLKQFNGSVPTMPKGFKMLPEAYDSKNAKEHWKPGCAIYSTFNGITWREKGKYTFTYDGEGHTLTELQENLDKNDSGIVNFALYTNRYDEMGRLMSSTLEVGDSQSEMEPYQRTSVKYDPVLPYVVTEQISETYIGSEWLFNEQTYRRNITRNDNGDITDMIASTWYDDDFLEVEHFHASYDGRRPTDLAVRYINMDDNGNFYWEDGEIYADCDWYEYDGQLISLNDISTGTNKLKSAVLSGAGLKNAAISIEYDGENYVSTLDFLYQDLIPTNTEREYKVLPNNGYELHVDQQMHVGQWTGIEGEVFQQIQDINETYDDFGNLTEAKATTFYGHLMIDSWTVGEVTFDQTGSYPIKYLRKEFTPVTGTTNGEWNDLYTLEYSGWMDVAGIGNISYDIKAGAPVYYTIDGLPVKDEGLQPGVYIKIEGNKSHKIIIR